MSSVLVTGASRGIGLATCVALARAGHRVFGAMRDPQRAPELRQVAVAEDLPITVVTMDVDSDDSVRDCVGAIIEEHGPLDALGIAHEIADSSYPHERRMAGLFRASLLAAAGPEVVGEKIREVIEDDSAGLRHAVGPDALPFLHWRASLSDEQWVDWAAVDDETWYASVASDFGLDARA